MTPISRPQGFDQPAPAYAIFDPNDPDGQLATNAGQMIISPCLVGGSYDQTKVRKLLDMVVRYVRHETGVLPSVTTNSATRIPANNNPTNPDEWDWSVWESNHLPANGIRSMTYSKRRHICGILGAGLEKDLDKVKAILEHQLFVESFIESARSTIPSHLVKSIVYSAKTLGNVVDDLFGYYENQRAFSPTGLIKAAIVLGYLPREDIQKLYDMSIG